MEQSKHYLCRNVAVDGFPDDGHPVWQDAPTVSFVDVQTGRMPALETSFQIIRDDQHQCFFVRFHGEDDRILSDFFLHDEPLWRQDVVELFIADEGHLRRYKELQCSPWDVHFDGVISFDEDGIRSLDLSWDVEGWVSRSGFDPAQGRMYSVWQLPYAAFAQAPQAGHSWRFNAFRVDCGADGQSLQAWQKTGQNNFHMPEYFGWLDFEA